MTSRPRRLQRAALTASERQRRGGNMAQFRSHSHISKVMIHPSILLDTEELVYAARVQP